MGQTALFDELQLLVCEDARPPPRETKDGPRQGLSSPFSRFVPLTAKNSHTHSPLLV